MASTNMNAMVDSATAAAAAAGAAFMASSHQGGSSLDCVPSTSGRVGFITSDQLNALRLRQEEFAIVDVRDDERMLWPHIPGSLHCPSVRFEQEVCKVAERVKNKKHVVFHCALSQVRGPRCAQKFADIVALDPTATCEVHVLQHGFQDWFKAGCEVCRCRNPYCVRESHQLNRSQCRPAQQQQLSGAAC